MSTENQIPECFDGMVEFADNTINHICAKPLAGTTASFRFLTRQDAVDFWNGSVTVKPISGIDKGWAEAEWEYRNVPGYWMLGVFRVGSPEASVPAPSSPATPSESPERVETAEESFRAWMAEDGTHGSDDPSHIAALRAGFNAGWKRGLLSFAGYEAGRKAK